MSNVKMLLNLASLCAEVGGYSLLWKLPSDSIRILLLKRYKKLTPRFIALAEASGYYERHPEKRNEHMSIIKNLEEALA